MKFIVLNKVSERGVYKVFINAEHIVYFAKGFSDSNCIVYLSDDTYIHTLETEDEILEKIGQEVVCTSVLVDKEAVKIKANTILLGGRTDD